MSIAEKLVKIAENEQAVFEAGVKSEYDRFWDIVQSKSIERNEFMYMFAYWAWEYGDPKEPIVIDGAGTVIAGMFYNCRKLKTTRTNLILLRRTLQAICLLTAGRWKVCQK